MIENCIAPIIDSFYDRHREVFVKKPEVTIATDYMDYMWFSLKRRMLKPSTTYSVNL